MKTNAILIAESAREFGLIAIGSSLGGVAALKSVLSPLPAFFPAPIVLAQHMSAKHETLLPELIQRWTDLKVRRARCGDRLEAGSIYVAPNSQDMTVEGGILRLSRNPRASWPHPSVDRLFTSAAEGFGPRAIGVVLTGLGTDGAAGVAAVRARGGRVFVQDPATAAGRDMPLAAISTGCVDLVLPVAVISRALLAMAAMPGTSELFDIPAPPWASFN